MWLFHQDIVDGVDASEEWRVRLAALVEEDGVPTTATGRLLPRPRCALRRVGLGGGTAGQCNIIRVRLHPHNLLLVGGFETQWLKVMNCCSSRSYWRLRVFVTWSS